MRFLHEYDIKFVDGKVNRNVRVIEDFLSEEEVIEYVKSKEKDGVFHTKRLFELKEIKLPEL